MTLWSSDAIAKAVSGRCSGTWSATGVSIDSRTVAKGDLFIALKGPSFDGHKFVADALEKGAVGALVHDTTLDSGEYHNRLVVVKDTFAALEDLARAARARTNAKVIAVTGSVGKTGTKEALKLALSVQGATHATEGNLNNHWGVPLSLARMPTETRYAVFELGMNHPGEIAPLSKLVRPHVCVITTVEAAHLEFFNSVAEIADEKASIMAGLEPGGTAILPSDNPHYTRLAAAAKKYGARIVAFGTGGDATARLFAWSLTPDGTQVAAEFDGERITYDMIVSGRHWALNSIASIAAAKAVGADIHLAAAALAKLAAPAGRGARRRVPIANGTVLVIDESYNASPAAVRVLADTMAQMHQPVGGSGGRLLLALGDMRELGNTAPELHAGLAPSLKAAAVDLVFTAGPMMRNLHEALPREMRGAHAEDVKALIPTVMGVLKPGDVIAVKGSHASRMDLLVDALLALAGKHAA
jgi:UDP-N-acetylmuramoyl-tripeptide--D-alanyl-D-alanine ligase